MLFYHLEEKQDPTEILANMVLLAKFLSDISLDGLWSSAAVSGMAVAGCRLLWLKSWKLHATQRNLLQKLPFLGPKLFGTELDDMVQKAADQQKIIKPFKLAAINKSF